MTKTCSVCNQAKPIDQFDRDSSISSGYRGRCKPCRSAIESERKRAKRQGKDTKIASLRAARARVDDAAEKQRRLLSEANQGAIKRLLRAHPEEFERFVEDERVRLGVKPRWTQISG